MNYFSSRIIFFFVLLLSIVFPAYASETYTLDPSHTYVLWHINHMGYSIQTGKFTMIDGTLSVDEAKPQLSKVDVTIHTDKIVTGIPKLDEHLQSGEFFNVQKFPTATFVSDKVEVTGKKTGKIYGTLTLLGISKPVVLDAKLLEMGMHPINNIKSLGFSATTKIKRSEFGMNKYLPGLGDEVQIDIGGEAKLSKTEG